MKNLKRDEKEDYHLHCLDIIEKNLDAFLEMFTKAYAHKNKKETFNFFMNHGLEYNWTVYEVIYKWCEYPYWQDKFKNLVFELEGK